MESFFNYLQFGIFLLSLHFACSTTITQSYAQCEPKCTKWEFVCKKPSYSPKSPYVVCNPSDFPRNPTCADDVAKIVKEAKSKGVGVKSFGNQQGQTDLICTEGIPMSVSALKTCKMNPDKTVTCGAGVNLYECGEFLRKNDRALVTLSVYGNITLAGAILTGEQGNSLKFDATISSQVVRITIINSSGEIQVISCPEELKAFSLSLGLLGIVIDITLSTVELYKVQAHNYIHCDSILSNGEAIRWARNTDELSLYWFPESNDVVVSNRTIVCADTPGNAQSNDYWSSTYANFAKIFTKAKETAFGLTSSTCSKANAVGYEILNSFAFFVKSSLVEQTPEMPPIYTEDGTSVQNPAVGYPHRISSPICNGSPQGPNGAACPDSQGANSLTTLDYEFSIATCDLADFVKIVRDVTKKTPTSFAIFGIRITFSGKSKLYLSTSYERESVNVAFRMLNRKNLFSDPSGSLAGYQILIQVLINKYGGRSNWGKGGLVAHNSQSIDLKLEKCARDSFIGVLTKNDPKGVFINKIGLRLKGVGTKIDANPLSTRCALLGGCFCSKDGDCGADQTCTTIPGYDQYRVCKTKNEEHQCGCKKPALPPLCDLVKYLDEDVAKLAAAALSKC